MVWSLFIEKHFQLSCRHSLYFFMLKNTSFSIYHAFLAERIGINAEMQPAIQPALWVGIAWTKLGRFVYIVFFLLMFLKVKCALFTPFRIQAWFNVCTIRGYSHPESLPINACRLARTSFRSHRGLFQFYTYWFKGREFECSVSRRI